jgi:Uncharacterized conserved protein, contains S4-like domain
MNKEERILKNRFLELANICYERDIPIYSDFLSLNEQTIFRALVSELPPIKYILQGGYEPSERKIVCFFPYFYLENCTNISIIKISAINEKFAEELTHRDYLGAIMNLGIERSKIGDILVNSPSCFLMTVDSLAEYICREINTVKRTSVTAKIITDEIEALTQKYDIIEGSIASLRIDNILALILKTSRTKVLPLITAERVFINGCIVTSVSKLIVDEDIISVRGYGKFQFITTLMTTRKDRAFVSIKKYL